MLVRLLKPWRNHRAGKVLDVNEGVAELWRGRGRCECMVPPVSVVMDVGPSPKPEHCTPPIHKPRRSRVEAL